LISGKQVESAEAKEELKPKSLNAEHLQILVAEDDPVNSRIIQKRLEKSGHEVHHTVSGEDCASAYG
jgi:PleD family two-component response regulator